MNKIHQNLPARTSVFALFIFLFSCQKVQLTATPLPSTVLNVAADASISYAASAASNNLVADWETGNADQWYGLNLAYSNQYSTVTWPVRQGRFAGKFTVRPGDVSSGGERSEVSMWLSRTSPINNYTQEVPGSDFYYGWSTQFPWDWKTPPGYCIFYQFQQRADNLHPSIAFNVLGESIQVNFNTGIVHGYSWAPSNSFAFMPTHNQMANPIIVNSLSRGKWHDFIVHVRFAPDNSGICEIWHRLEGSADFTKVLDYPHVPTEQWTTYPGTFLTEGVYTHYSLNNVTGCVPNTYVKMGLYRPVVRGNYITNTIYGDNWSRSTTFSGVRSKFK